MNKLLAAFVFVAQVTLLVLVAQDGLEVSACRRMMMQPMAMRARGVRRSNNVQANKTPQVAASAAAATATVSAPQPQAQVHPQPQMTPTIINNIHIGNSKTKGSLKDKLRSAGHTLKRSPVAGGDRFIDSLDDEEIEAILKLRRERELKEMQMITKAVKASEAPRDLGELHDLEASSAHGVSATAASYPVAHDDYELYDDIEHADDYLLDHEHEADDDEDSDRELLEYIKSLGLQREILKQQALAQHHEPKVMSNAATGTATAAETTPNTSHNQQPAQNANMRHRQLYGRRRRGRVAPGVAGIAQVVHQVAQPALKRLSAGHF